MLNLDNLKAFELPKEKKILDCEDWYITVNELGTIKLYKESTTAPEELKAKQNEILETERQLESKATCELEKAELKDKLRKLESEYNYLSEPHHLQKSKCRGLTSENLLKKWIEFAGDRKTNTVYSIAYATGRRSEDSDPETYIETERQRD